MSVAALLLIVVMAPSLESPTPDAACVLEWRDARAADTTYTIKPPAQYLGRLTFRGQGCMPAPDCGPTATVEFRIERAPGFLQVRLDSNRSGISFNFPEVVAQNAVRFDVPLSVAAGTGFEVEVSATCGSSMARAVRVFRVLDVPLTVLELNHTYRSGLGQHWMFDAFNGGNVPVWLEWNVSMRASRSGVEWQLPPDHRIPVGETRRFDLALVGDEVNGSFPIFVIPHSEADPLTTGERIRFDLQVLAFQGRSTGFASLGLGLLALLAAAAASRKGAA